MNRRSWRTVRSAGPGPGTHRTTEMRFGGNGSCIERSTAIGIGPRRTRSKPRDSRSSHSVPADRGRRAHVTVLRCRLDTVCYCYTVAPIPVPVKASYSEWQAAVDKHDGTPAMRCVLRTVTGMDPGEVFVQRSGCHRPNGIGSQVGAGNAPTVIPCGGSLAPARCGARARRSARSHAAS